MPEVKNSYSSITVDNDLKSNLDGDIAQFKKDTGLKNMAYNDMVHMYREAWVKQNAG